MTLERATAAFAILGEKGKQTLQPLTLEFPNTGNQFM